MSTLGQILVLFLFLLLLPTTFLEPNGDVLRKTSTPLRPTTWFCQPLWTHRLDACHPWATTSSIPWL